MFSSIVRGSKPFAAEQEIRKIKIFFSKPQDSGQKSE